MTHTARMEFFRGLGVLMLFSACAALGRWAGDNLRLVLWAAAALLAAWLVSRLLGWFVPGFAAGFRRGWRRSYHGETDEARQELAGRLAADMHRVAGRHAS